MASLQGKGERMIILLLSLGTINKLRRQGWGSVKAHFDNFPYELDKEETEPENAQSAGKGPSINYVDSLGGVSGKLIFAN